MGQEWKLIAPESWECFNWMGLELRQLLFNGDLERAVIHLAVPPKKRILTELIPVPELFPSSVSPLVDLPTEILEEIISNLGVAETFFLGMCSQRLYFMCREHLINILASQCGRFAGTSLICFGDGIDNHDFPPGIDWWPEIEEMQKLSNECLSPYDLVGEFFTEIRGPPGLISALCLGTKSGPFSAAMSPLPRSYRVEIWSFLEFDHCSLYTNGPEWILRNLTTKEFVRHSVVAHGSNGPFRPTPRGVGFGEVLAVRTCWSSMAASCGIHRGVWAGHRFDITLMDAIEGADGWKDVSESLFEEIQCIWKRKYGDLWEEEWSGRGNEGPVRVPYDYISR
ncbi:hypothetical protein FN846DRAFT_962595 [Sphaerosporella brunnea]|uniref:F-box domain-containing protein n=1 Tax=Sphaerosporella brunnea TaxID=1250544 RepID=A0A5J5EP30_9PEZI|nr:hypothetical protein FN846DRAFT_962595 [Sphaerosporella brunnea]